MKRKVQALRVCGWVVFFLCAGCMSSFDHLAGDQKYRTLKFKAGSEPDGFRGIGWGTPLAAVPGMKYVGKNEDRLEIYVKEDEDLNIGAARVENIHYHFWHGKFCGVEVSARETRNCRALRDSVFERFGSGLKAGSDKNFFGEGYLYQGEKAFVFLSIQEQLEDSGLLIIYSREIKKKINAEKKERAQKSF